MSDGKLKQNHVFVKNNVGSLALHKAKQEIGGIKTIDKKDMIEWFICTAGVIASNNISYKDMEVLRNRFITEFYEERD